MLWRLRCSQDGRMIAPGCARPTGCAPHALDGFGRPSRRRQGHPPQDARQVRTEG